MDAIDKVIVGVYGTTAALGLSLGGYGTYLDFTDEALENVSPLAKKYDENKDNKLQLVEAIKLVANEFDKNKDGHLSKEEHFEIDRFIDKFRGRLQHRNIQKAKQNLVAAGIYCGEWSEDLKNIEAMKEWPWTGLEQAREEILKYIALRNSKK